MKLDCELEEMIEDYFRLIGKVKLDGFIMYEKMERICHSLMARHYTTSS